MRSIKLLSAYIWGNKLDRMAIQKKIFKKFGQNGTNDRTQKFKFKQLIDVDSLLKVDTIQDDTYIHYMNHEYDFLGLGWANWNCSSVNEPIDGYKKIAWNKDINSGYDFPYTNFINTIPKGTDIKIPWELARMQYWPQIALYGLKHSDRKEEVLIEFQNQMLDFMKCNPLESGIHFYCAMEVAIRSVNLMIAYDIISQYKMNCFTQTFVNAFEEYIFSHLHVIIARLEKNYFTGHTGNHYLTDLCGILWICMYFEFSVFEV